MKKIYGIFIAASLLCSCEAFLDEKPLAEITRETTQTSELVSAYETAADAQLELNGAYAWLKCDMYEGIWFYIGECMSDNCYIGGDGISEEQLGNMLAEASRPTWAHGLRPPALRFLKDRVFCMCV